MNHVQVTKETIAATNGHILMWDQPCNNFDDEFCSLIPDEGLLIHSEDWKKFDKSYWVKFRDQNTIEIYYRTKRKVLIEVETEKTIGKFPNWRAVVPNINDVSPIGELGVNPTQYKSIIDAYGTGYNFQDLKLVFTGANRAICIKENNVDFNLSGAIIMPYKVEEII
ncbi:MAG: hypothetical protein DRQ98_14565 [Gammaproteobacteria bacterium]|nr:MAG: hypothetical protein DRQ98_14565 [Gammaproteobacteria bacterium]